MFFDFFRRVRRQRLAGRLAHIKQRESLIVREMVAAKNELHALRALEAVTRHELGLL